MCAHPDTQLSRVPRSAPLNLLVTDYQLTQTIETRKSVSARSRHLPTLTDNYRRGTHKPATGTIRGRRSVCGSNHVTSRVHPAEAPYAVVNYHRSRDLRPIRNAKRKPSDCGPEPVGAGLSCPTINSPRTRGRAHPEAKFNRVYRSAPFNTIDKGPSRYRAMWYRAPVVTS